MYRTTSLLIFALLIGVLAMLVWQRLLPNIQITPSTGDTSYERPGGNGGPAETPAAAPIGAAASAEGALPARLEGTPTADTGARRLRGMVIRGEGSEPLGVGVYLLPKGVEGAETVEHGVQPDDDGRFDLGEIDPAGHWIAAMAQDVEPEYAPVFVDGDAWDGGEVTLRLDAGRTIEVRVIQDAAGAPPSRLQAIVTPATTGRRWVFPGPAAIPAFTKKKNIDGEGIITFRLPTAGRVRVRVEAPNHSADPAEIVLAPEERLASFRLHGVGTLRVRTKDAETGASLDARATVSVLSLSTGREVVATRAFHLPEWMEAHGLRPGRYALLVRAPGYVPASVPEIEVDRPGAEAETTVALSLDPGAGMARVKLLFPQGESLGSQLVHVEGRRRSAPTPEARAWKRLRPRAVDVDRATVTLGPLDLGDWELVVWAGAERVGRTEVGVQGGFPDGTDVTLAEGLAVDLLRAMPDAESDIEDVFIQLRRPDGDLWPPVRFQSQQRLIGLGGGADAMPTERVERGGVVAANAVLGPYPSDEVQVYVLEGETWKPAETIRAE